MTKTGSRLGAVSLIAGFLSAGLFFIVAVGAFLMPAQLSLAQLIAAGVMMLGQVLSGFLAMILGLIGIFRAGKKAPAVAGALMGGASVGLLVLLIVIGQRVGGAGPLSGPPALRTDTMAK